MPCSLAVLRSGGDRSPCPRLSPRLEPAVCQCHRRDHCLLPRHQSGQAAAGETVFMGHSVRSLSNHGFPGRSVTYNLRGTRDPVNSFVSRRTGSRQKAHPQHPPTQVPAPLVPSQHNRPARNTHSRYPLPAPVPSIYSRHPLATSASSTRSKYPLPVPTSRTRSQHLLPTPAHDTRFRYPLPLPAPNTPSRYPPARPRAGVPPSGVATYL